MTHCIRTNRDRRGQILLLTAFLVFVLFTLAFSFFKLLPTELHSALKTKQTVTAQVVADSGIKEARVWLESQPQQKILNQQILNSQFNNTAEGNPVNMGDTWTDGASSAQKLGRFHYKVRLDVNESAPYTFDATSTCYFDGKPLRQTRATLARDNFSRYALFIDRWREELLMTPSAGAIQGPFHTNDFFRLIVPPDFYANPSEPFVGGVNGAMTHAGSTSEGTVGFDGDGNAYHSFADGTVNSSEETVPYDADGAIDSRYNALVNGGRSNLKSTDHILLPYSADELLVTSLGGESENSNITVPSDIGMYVSRDGSDRVNGGIFIVGDVDMRLSINSDGNQVHHFTQAIPEEAYRFITQEQYQHPLYGDVTRTLGLGDTYYESSSVTQMVDVQKIVGYETQTVTTTRQVQTGQQWVPPSGGSGNGTTVGAGSWQPVYETVVETSEQQVPIYETVQEERTNTVQNPVTISDPSDPNIGTEVTSYEQIGTETRTRDVVNVIDADTYDANPDSYPNATKFFTPGAPKTATVTEVAGPNPTTEVVDYEGQSFTYSGSLNGVTFVDGNVKSLEGVSKGAQDPNFATGDVFTGRYIAANPTVATRGTMTITDDLLQYYDGDSLALQGDVPNTLKIGELSPDSQHSLGLVARDTYLKPESNNILNLYSVILAGHSIPGTENDENVPNVEGGFGSDPSIMNSSYGQNTFNLYGGLIQANQREWIDPDENGLFGNLVYDAAVAGNMPRFPRSNLVTTLRYADRYVDNEASI